MICVSVSVRLRLCEDVFVVLLQPFEYFLSSLTMVLREVPAENIARPLGRNEVIGLLFRLTIFGAVTYFTIKWMVDAIDPTRKQKVEAQKQVSQGGGGV